MTRISVGVDVSKNRSTVCIMDQDGKVIMRPFLVWHSTEELDFLADTLERLNGEVRVIMESTSIYQYPIALHLKEKGIFNKEVAQSFRENILEKGGSEHPMELYKKFRGRGPKIDPLLKRAGLIA